MYVERALVWNAPQDVVHILAPRRLHVLNPQAPQVPLVLVDNRRLADLQVLRHAQPMGHGDLVHHPRSGEHLCLRIHHDDLLECVVRGSQELHHVRKFVDLARDALAVLAQRRVAVPVFGRAARAGRVGRAKDWIHAPESSLATDRAMLRNRERTDPIGVLEFAAGAEQVAKARLSLLQQGRGGAELTVAQRIGDHGGHEVPERGTPRVRHHVLGARIFPVHH
mmetsp:Transcript_53414/g.162254  ORF Transcript_53414/g.162254 Transcript_53414/m.162254 type:complete len:223 (-) Transcript_53414:59-727(-)